MLATAAAIALSPVLAVQAAVVRMRTPRLPAAPGATVGRAGDGPPLRVSVLGESAVAGVGAGAMARGLAGRFAEALAGRCDRAVVWRAVGETGVDAAAARRRLMPLTAGHDADLVVLALGVNDVLAFHSAARWRTDLLRLIVHMRRSRGAVPVVVAGVPPLGAFPALPQPMRTVLGLRAAELDAATARLADRLPSVTHVPLPAELLAPGFFAADRFHPSERGYRRWADHLAAAVCAAGVVTPVRRPARAAD